MNQKTPKDDIGEEAMALAVKRRKKMIKGTEDGHAQDTDTMLLIM